MKSYKPDIWWVALLWTASNNYKMEKGKTVFLWLPPAENNLNADDSILCSDCWHLLRIYKYHETLSPHFDFQQKAIILFSSTNHLRFAIPGFFHGYFTWLHLFVGTPINFAKSNADFSSTIMQQLNIVAYDSKIAVLCQ